MHGLLALKQLSFPQVIKFHQNEEQPDFIGYLHNPTAGLFCFSQTEHLNKKNQKQQQKNNHLNSFMLQAEKK